MGQARGGVGIRWVLQGGLAGLLVAHALPARADAWQNVFTGARTTAMGGAGIAGGSDSAMPTLNPAGLARVPGSIVSLSASLYQLSLVTVPNYVADGDTIAGPLGDLQVSQPGIQSREFGAFPSGLAYFLHLGTQARPMVLAAALSVPRQVNRRVVQNLEFLGENVAIRSNLTTVVQETAYRLSASWAMGLGDLKLGASVVGAYTRLLRTHDQSDLTVLGTARFIREQSKSARAITSFDLGVVLGAQYDVMQGLRLGLSVRSPSVHLTGSVAGAEDLTYVDEAGSSVSATQIQGDGVRGFPLRVGLGAEAYGDTWAVALDARLHVPRSAEYQLKGSLLTSSLGGDAGAAPDRMRDLQAIEATQLTVDLSLGFEWWMDEDNSLRLGAFTQMTAQQSAEDLLASRGQARPFPEDYFRFPINRFGGSVGWGSRVGPADTTAGLNAAFGAGDTLRRAPERRFEPRAPGQLTSATSFEVQAFVSAAVDLSEAAAAVAGGTP